MIVSTKYEGELTAEVHGEFMAHVESMKEGILAQAFTKFNFSQKSVTGGIAFINKSLVYISPNTPEKVTMNLNGNYAIYLEYEIIKNTDTGIDDEKASVKTIFDSINIPDYPTSTATKKIMPLYTINLNGGSLTTKSDDREYLKTPLDLAIAEIDKLTASDIEGTDPSGKGGKNVQTIMNNIYSKIVEATGGDFWSKDEADGRFKRIVDINSEFQDSEFAGMNMAQIMNVIKTYMGSWGYTYEIVAECTNSLFPNLRDAMRDLVNEIFKTNITTPTLKFKMNRARRSGLGGCDVLEVGFDNGPIFYMQYDNYGTNWATVNIEAFEAAQKRYGVLGVEEINSEDGTTNITNNLKLGGTLYCDGQTRVLGGGLLTPFFHESSLTAVADETTLVKQNYGNGNTSMALGNLKATSSERTYTNLTKYDTTGSANRAILIFSSTASDAGVIHQVGSTNYKLAYNKDIAREALQKDNEYLPLLVEMQKSIDATQGLKADSDLLISLKAKQAQAQADLVELDKQDKITFAEEDLLQLQTNLSDVKNVIIEMKKAIDSIQELDGDSNLINTLKSKQEKMETYLSTLEPRVGELETQIAAKEKDIAKLKGTII